MNLNKLIHTQLITGTRGILLVSIQANIIVCVNDIRYYITKQYCIYNSTLHVKLSFFRIRFESWT